MRGSILAIAAGLLVTASAKADGGWTNWDDVSNDNGMSNGDGKSLATAKVTRTIYTCPCDGSKSTVTGVPQEMPRVWVDYDYSYETTQVCALGFLCYKSTITNSQNPKTVTLYPAGSGWEDWYTTSVCSNGKCGVKTEKATTGQTLTRTATQTTVTKSCGVCNPVTLTRTSLYTTCYGVQPTVTASTQTVYNTYVTTICHNNGKCQGTTITATAYTTTFATVTASPTLTSGTYTSTISPVVSTSTATICNNVGQCISQTFTITTYTTTYTTASPSTTPSGQISATLTGTTSGTTTTTTTPSGQISATLTGTTSSSTTTTPTGVISATLTGTSSTSTSSTSTSTTTTSTSTTTTSTSTTSTTTTSSSSIVGSPTIITTTTTSTTTTTPVVPTTTTTTTPAVVTTTTTTTTAAAAATQTIDVTGMTYINAMLTAHNVHRTNHSEVLLVWDANLASIAAQTASSCVYAHDTTTGGGGYGQNIGAGAAGNAAAGLINNLMYNGEINYYPQPYGQDNPDLSNFEAWGHYSQIVWSSTTNVGCATQYCPNGLQGAGAGVPPYFTVCNYSPAGNYLGQFSKVLPPQGGATVVIIGS